MDSVELLTLFGLTQQEAKIYCSLHGHDPATGYELAKVTGISRSNTYAGLSNLVEKGAAHQIDGKPIRYQAVPVSEFCRNVIRSLQASRDILERFLTPADDPVKAYLTVKGSMNIRNKIETLIEGTHHRIYISMAETLLRPFLPSLEKLVEGGRKVVIITNSQILIKEAAIYITQKPSDHIRVISDSVKALTGGLDESPNCTCLYSRKENLVSLIKDSIKNEIELIKLSGGDA